MLMSATRKVSNRRVLAMKKLFKLFFLLFLPLSLASCGNEPVKNPFINEIKLNATSIELDVNQSYNLVPTSYDLEGNKLENIVYRFNSSNKTVADIDATGKISAFKAGTSTITCIAGKQIASCLVKVAGGGGEQDVYSLGFSPDSVIIKLGSTYKPNVVTYPEGVTGLNYVWYSNDEKVATAADGIVTAVGVGSTEIKVVYGALSATLNVTVDEKGGDVFTISINPQNKTLLVGSTFQLEAVCSEQAVITWESENSGVASVDNNGLVSANGRGSTVISATANGVRASCTVTVKDKSDPEGDPDLEVFFYIDFNAATGDDVPYAKLDWYVGIPFGTNNKPADPTQAPDPAFPIFKGWSSHPIVDNIPEDLWDFENDVVPDGSYVMVLYGIWIDA